MYPESGLLFAKSKVHSSAYAKVPELQESRNRDID